MTSRYMATSFTRLPAIEGARVDSKRAFGRFQIAQLSPFLILKDLHSRKPDKHLESFPWPPSSQDRNDPLRTRWMGGTWQQLEREEFI